MVEITRILKEVGEGRPQASERLAEALYQELHAMARREMASERADHTLQPTALVHEAYLRLVPGGAGGFESRAHFFGAAASAIRRVLVDHARGRARLKRGGGSKERVPLDSIEPGAEPEAKPALDDGQLLGLEEALVELGRFAPSHLRIVELRFFAGMNTPEVAHALGVSESTVRRDWRLARAWLRERLGGDDGP